MDKKYYVPWETAAKLALMGFNEDCVRPWSIGGKLRLLPAKYNYYESNFWGHELRNIEGYYNKRNQLRQNYENCGYIFSVLRGFRVAACTYDQVREWFREYHKIDFVERPSIGAQHKYICDPVGTGLGDVRLESSDTPLEAQLKAFDYLLSVIKPVICKQEEEANQEQEDVAEVSYED